MLLPPAFQDKTQFLPLGKKVEKPEPLRADPVVEFERVSHDAPKARRSLMRDERPLAERQAAFDKASEIYSRSINGEYDPPAWDHIANRRAWAELNVEYDAEMAKARARLVEPVALGGPSGLSPARLSELANRAEEWKAVFERGASWGLDWPTLDAQLQAVAGITERKLDWPKLDI